MREAYLDIETTGLDWTDAEITVIGIYLVHENNERIIQLVGQQIKKGNLLRALERIDNIYTYNGTRFDLPFIKHALGVDLEKIIIHHDLMYICWNYNLYGGLKVVEQKLGIPRVLNNLNGLDAIILWQRYVKNGDKKALNTLLEYNKEDNLNLKILKEKLQMLTPFDQKKPNIT